MTDTLGMRIRLARVRARMSQTELARRIGISKTAMSQIELGKTPDPAASRIKAIADVLEVSTDSLFGREAAAEPLLRPRSRRPAKASAS